MSNKITQKQKVKNVLDFIGVLKNSFMYGCIHKSTEFDNDLLPPSIDESISESHYNLYDEMLFAKRITEQDVSPMIRNIPWESEKVFSIYDDKDPDLYKKDFYAVSFENGGYHVFKCLNNNNNSPSMDQPLLSETSPEDELYVLSDGYQWKYMFSITQNEFDKFANEKFIPIKENPLVTNAAINGTIETIIINSNESAIFQSLAKGVFTNINVGGNTLIHEIDSDIQILSSNNDFYNNSSIFIDTGSGAGQIRNIVDYFITANSKRILIDEPFGVNIDSTSKFTITPQVRIKGDGILASALSNFDFQTKELKNITIVNRGLNYTFADVELVGNSGIIENDVIEIGRAIISPPGGHGSDIKNEFFATSLGITISFNADENGLLNVNNDFRKFSILNNPLISKVTAIANLSYSNPSNLFFGETFTQTGTNVKGKISTISGASVDLIDVNGALSTSSFDSSNTAINLIVGDISGNEIFVNELDRDVNIIDQRLTIVGEILFDPTGNGLIDDEQVIQSFFGNVSFSGSINEVNLPIINITDNKGVLLVSDDVSGEIRNIEGLESGVIVKVNDISTSRAKFTDNSGDFLYIENFQPVLRNINQTETFKIIINF